MNLSDLAVAYRIARLEYEQALRLYFMVLPKNLWVTGRPPEQGGVPVPLLCTGF